jgi:Protein tyrosine/serine phosphatase
LMSEENTPLLFHCSAGKDRAGFGAALFLASLGVDRKIIIDDYLLTNKYLKDKYSDIVAQMPVLKPLFEVRKEYILAAFEVIDNEYGGIDSYLTNQLGVNLKRMRELYTE